MTLKELPKCNLHLSRLQQIKNQCTIELSQDHRYLSIYLGMTVCITSMNLTIEMYPSIPQHDAPLSGTLTV